MLQMPMLTLWYDIGSRTTKFRKLIRLCKKRAGLWGDVV